MEVGGSAGGARAHVDAGGDRPVKILAGVLLVIVIVVAVNAVLSQQGKPTLAVLQGGKTA